MHAIPSSITPKVSLVSMLVISSLPILVGCSKSKIPEPRTQDPLALSLADFVGEKAFENRGEVETQPFVVETQNQQETEPTSTYQSEIVLVDSNDRTIDSEPEHGSTQTTRTGAYTLLDAKIGDVNGKPIFTNSFFESIEDRLIAEAETQTNVQAWRNAAGRMIANQLDGMIADELLRAEALAALTPNQRVGLQAFLNNFRNNVLSENLGSSELARKRLLESQGQTLDQVLEQKQVDTLVQLTLIQEVNRRVNVSWRDIQQRYERDIDKFSPPPTAVLRVIRAFSSDTDNIEQIKQELESGKSFLSISAGPLNTFNTNADGMKKVLIEDGFENTAFFGPAEALNIATNQLSVGEQVGPIEHGTSTYWIKLMDIEQESISLYDAQLQIQRELTFERRRAVQEEYLSRLMERAKISSRDEVIYRLLDIAESRYGPKS